MEVNSILTTIYSEKTFAKTNSKRASRKEDEFNQKTDGYEKTKPEKKNTYTVDRNELNKMKAEMDARLEELRTLLSGVTQKQAFTFEYAYGKITSDNYEFSFQSLQITYEDVFFITPETQQKAQEAIAEDGYWGVEQTAKRILDFAKLFGGDSSRIGILKQAFKDGFNAAEEVWGSKLPDICYKTYDKVMEGFAEMEEGSEKV